VNARPVVAAEDFTAAQRLADLARTFRMAVSFEHVPLGGAIDLDRPNLVVICGPRLSEDVAGVLRHDPVIAFERAPDGLWILRDQSTGMLYRSGQDSADRAPVDYAYLGRLERPDGQGNVLVFTGIHPPGTLGVVQLITSDIAELYAQVHDGRFSVIVQVTYDPATHEPESASLASPLYQHQAAS
jgi:hypothetical protein